MLHTLASFDRPVRAVVVGASGGIGSAFIELLSACSEVESIIACSRKPQPPANSKVIWRTLDILDEASIEKAIAGIERLDLIVVATGQLHTSAGTGPEKTWRALDKSVLLESFAVNAIGPALVAKHFLPLMPRADKAVFAALSARVGSISDNHLGGWYGYRASKAALNQLIRTLSIELARKRQNAICVGLHPGTVNSELSRPFLSNVAKGRLFTPKLAASHLLNVIDRLQPPHSGQLLAWDGSVIEA